MKRRAAPTIETREAFEARVQAKVDAGCARLARMTPDPKHKGVIGLDLSLRSPGACWIPRGWLGRVARVRTAGAGWGYELTRDATPADVAARHIAIAERVVDFCRRHPHEAVFVEDYAYSRNSSSATGLHELGGVVKADLLRALGRAPIPVTASEARKTLLTNVPRSDSKSFVIANVRMLGGKAVYWSEDEADAFCLCNHGCKLLGWTHLNYEGK